MFFASLTTSVYGWTAAKVPQIAPLMHGLHARRRAHRDHGVRRLAAASPLREACFAHHCAGHHGTLSSLAKRGIWVILISDF